LKPPKDIDDAFIAAVLKARASWDGIDTSDWRQVLDALDSTTWATIFTDEMTTHVSASLGIAAKQAHAAEKLRGLYPAGLEDYVKVRTAQLVTEVTSTTKQGLRVVVDLAYKSGQNPKDAARQLKPLIGLHSRQTQALWNRAVRLRERKMGEARIAKEQEKMARKMLRARSELIARTELTDIREEAKQRTWLDAISSGEIPATALKEWVAAPGERTCDVCGALSGQRVPVMGYFVLGGKSYARPPAHPSCRCPCILVRDKV
jgi:hypothetical protein